MKKSIFLVLAICLTLTIPGYSGSSGDLQSFLAEAEGDWYDRGNVHRHMLRIEADGAWEYHALQYNEDMELTGDRALKESGEAGSISYNSEDKNWRFTGKKYFYRCEITKDGLFDFNGVLYVPAHESRDLGETFNGGWYLDGDKDKDYYLFEDGIWKYYEAQGMGHSSTKFGYLSYRGGDTRTLTAVDTYAEDPFAVLTVVGGDEIQSADGKSYLRLQAEASDDSDE